jgi:hypothetical protein
MRGQTISMPKEVINAFDDIGFNWLPLSNAQSVWVQETL